jgi:hypothetical protein
MDMTDTSTHPADADPTPRLDPTARGAGPASSRDGPEARPGTPSSAATLAAGVHQLLESLKRSRVPRLESLRTRLAHAESGWNLPALDAALHALHEASEALDFLAPRGGAADAAAFRAQALAIGESARGLARAAQGFVASHATTGLLIRKLWTELKNEARSLEQRVQNGLQWLIDMEQDLEARAAETTVEVTRRALEELGRRGHVLENRLYRIQGVCGSARAAGTLADQLASHRAVLSRLLTDKVRPASAALEARLQPLLAAAGERQPEAAELLVAIEARHQLQVTLTQAAAELMQLDALHRELQAQLSWMERKAARVE